MSHRSPLYAEPQLEAQLEQLRCRILDWSCQIPLRCDWLGTELGLPDHAVSFDMVGECRIERSSENLALNQDGSAGWKGGRRLISM